MACLQNTRKNSIVWPRDIADNLASLAFEAIELTACRRLLFLSACNKGNRRRLHAGKRSRRSYGNYQSPQSSGSSWNILKRLGRSGRSGRSYGNQALEALKEQKSCDCLPPLCFTQRLALVWVSALTMNLVYLSSSSTRFTRRVLGITRKNDAQITGYHPSNYVL